MKDQNLRGTVIQISRSAGGIPKAPVQEAWISAAGVDGDSWAHPRVHGGTQQAILLITLESIQELKSLGFPVYPGAMGENITVDGLDRRWLRRGQIFRAGAVTLALTKLRQPCRTLERLGAGISKAVFDSSAKRSDPSSPVWARGGFYARVQQPGMLRTGDTITLEA